MKRLVVMIVVIMKKNEESAMKNNLDKSRKKPLKEAFIETEKYVTP
jgi:hypothetical protein